MNKIANYIIRPDRRLYNPEKDLGATLFTIDHKFYGSRTDFEVRNRRKKLIKCSLFHHNLYNGERHPLIVYCHGNSGNRTYSHEIVYRMLKAHCSVLTFDFAGCGVSEGKYVFLGYFEQYDIDDVLEHALGKFKFIDPERIGVWGRSMGAVSALLFASRNTSISLIVLDSPFKDFAQLLKEYISRFKVVSLLFGGYIYKKLRRIVQNKASFDFEDLKPIRALGSCKVPAFFYTAIKDKVVPRQHTKDLYDAYPGEKEYMETKGGHNTKRQPEVYDAITKFIEKVFERKVGISSTTDQLESIDNIQYAQSFFDETQRTPTDPLSIPKITVSRTELLTGKDKEEKQVTKKKKYLEVHIKDTYTKGPKPNKGDDVPDLSDGLIDEKSEVEDAVGVALCEELKKGVTGLISPKTSAGVKLFLTPKTSEVSASAETAQSS